MKRLDRGFTLVEMLVVLTIIAVVLAAAAPSFKTFSDKRKLDGAGEAIRSLSLFARDAAIAEKEPYIVVFDFIENRFWLAKGSALEYGDLAQTALLGAYGPEAEEMQPEQLQTMRAHGVLGEPRENNPGVTIQRVDVEREGEIVSNALDYEYVLFNEDGTAEPASVYLMNEAGQAAVVDVWLRASRIDIRPLSEGDASSLGLM